MNRRLLINVCVVAALLGAGLVLVLGSGDDDDSKAPAASAPTSSPPSGVVKTELPNLTPETSEPEPDGIRTAPAAPRNVTVLPGPFDDRFMFSDLRFDGTAVSGKVTISDAGDVLELQVLAGFYSANGTFLGEARFTYHLGGKQHTDGAGPPSEVEPFRIAVPAKFRGQAKSAAVGVPVLVNE